MELSSSLENELRAWLRLSLNPMLKPSMARGLLRAFGLPQDILACSIAQLQQVVPVEVAHSLLEPLDISVQDRLERTLEWVSSPMHTILSLADTSYPSDLLRLSDPPLLLYIDGHVEALGTQRIAVVGSRHPTVSGEENAHSFATYLASHELCVVSGLAVGIDAAAHQGALKTSNALATIAVMGTGMNYIYPSVHRSLALEIRERGALVSELPLDTKAMPYQFPARNRIVAALSQGVLVVEAAAKSGSLITAHLALEMGKEVFAIPGSIHSSLSRGCHALIRQGAKLVESGQDILEELQLVPVLSSRSEELPASDDESMSKKREVRQNNQAKHVKSSDLKFLRKMGFEPVSLDQLVMSTGLDWAGLSIRLLELELIGRVRRLPDGRYQQIS